MNFVVLKLLWFHDVVSHRWAHIIKISTLQRVRIFLAFLSSLSALPWSVSKALTDGLCLRTAGLLGSNHEFFDASERTYLPYFALVVVTRTKSLTDGLCVRTAGMLGSNHEFFGASDRTYLSGICLALH